MTTTVDGGSARRSRALETRYCTRCGALVFGDMDVCYECLGELRHDEPVRLPVEELVPTEVYVPESDCPARGDVEMTHSYALRVFTHDLDATIPIPSDGLVIGRAEGCDIVLHARSVSRRHVRVEPGGNGVSVQDLGAKNGVVVRGSPMGECATLRPGDEMSICGTSFSLVLMDEQA